MLYIHARTNTTTSAVEHKASEFGKRAVHQRLIIALLLDFPKIRRPRTIFHQLRTWRGHKLSISDSANDALFFPVLPFSNSTNICPFIIARNHRFPNI